MLLYNILSLNKKNGVVTIFLSPRAYLILYLFILIKFKLLKLIIYLLLLYWKSIRLDFKKYFV